MIVFDTETTGLISNHLIPLDKQPYIIEFYACKADPSTGEISAELDLLIKPPDRGLVTPEITKITGLTYDEHLTNASPFAMHADQIAAFLESDDLIIGQNLSFDMEMVDIEFERLGRRIVWPKRGVCLVEQTIHTKGYRLNLNDLHETLFGEKFKGAHRAKVDVAATLRCAVELNKRGLI